MKKITAIILAAGMLFNGIVLMSISAGAESIDDNLVVHYDFEGETLEEALSDKAPSGTTSDNLGVKSGATDTVSDICTWDKNKGTLTNDKIQKRSVQAANSADIQCMKDRNATVFMRFKVQEFDDENNTCVFDMRTDFKMYSSLSLFVNGDRKVLGTCYWNYSTGVLNYFFTPSQYVSEADKYVNVALVIAPVSGQTYASVTPYYCLGEPASAEDWTKGEAGNVNVNNYGMLNNPLSFFAMPTEAEGGGIVTVDDFRIYNKTLTLDEISGIFVNETFDTIHLVGTQKRAGDKADTTDVRFVAITDYLDADAIGFKIDVSYKDGGVLKKSPASKYIESRKVYKSITAGGSVISAEELGGKYVAALSVNAISNSYTDVTFTVTPYRVYDSVKIYGNTVTVKLNDIKG